MTAPRKLYQIAVIPKPDGAVLYARRDDVRLFRYFDAFGEKQAEWIEIPLPPGVKPFTGDNGAPEY